MFLPPEITSTIVECAHWADRIVRADLIEGLIAGENDYTSNFTSTLRRELNARAVPNLRAQSFVLQPGVERVVGADACIIIATPTHFKICVYEAKWPRLSTHTDYWDSVQKSSGHSHFHDQLTRQGRVAHTFAAWEMFYCEYPFGKQPSCFPDFGSACVWHAPAYAASTARPKPTEPWRDAELEELLQESGQSIADIMHAVCTCQVGQPIPGSDFRRPFLDYGVPGHALLISYRGPDSQDRG